MKKILIGREEEKAVLCMFLKTGTLCEEFTFLLQSLFSKAEQHIVILTALSTKNKYSKICFSNYAHAFWCPT